MATIAEVARILDVDRESVKRWATDLAEYLSLTANPKVGEERRYTEADLRVLAVIAEHYEMDDQADDIHYALNSGYQHEDRFVEFARLHSPLFQKVPEKIDETWQHGVLIGGMACRDQPQVARAYKLAADGLVKQALASQEPHELDYPILFLYRHTIELYLKTALTSPPEHHDLGRLIQLFEAECGNKVAGWIRDRLLDFHKIDCMSDMFRYAEPPSFNEQWVDLHQVKAVIDRLVEAFESYIASKATAKARL